MKRTKMLSLLLSIVMLLGLFVPAYAQEEAKVLTVLNGAAGTNGMYGSVDIYKTYMNTTLNSVDAGTTYAWQPNANGAVESVTKNHSANLSTNKALWCPSGWGYEYTLSNPALTYTVRFDMKDWYEVERIDVHEINVSDENGIGDISVSVGLNTYAMREAETTSSTVLGDSTIFANHAKSKANIEVLNTAKRGRYVDVTLTTKGVARVTSIMIFGKKLEKKELNLISGNVVTNSERYGNKDVYAQFLDTNLNSLSTAATYTWEPAAVRDAALKYMNDGGTWIPANWSQCEWLTDESVDYVVTYDLKNIFEITRVDLHELSVNKWNYINGFSVAVGTSMDNLTPVETTMTKKMASEVDPADTNTYRANMAELKTPVEGRYVQVTIDVGSDACVGEIMVFGNSIERTEYTLISPNPLTEADKNWYEQNQKIHITEAGSDTTYQWATFGLEEKEARNTIAPLARRLDDDYNGDGIGGEKNIADANITSLDAEHIVPLAGAGNNAVIYDFGKKMAVSRVDVHELVKKDTGLGTITVFYGDEPGVINQTAKKITLTYSDADVLTHKLDAIDLGTPVETRFLALSFSMDDGNEATANTNGYVLGDVLIFGKEAEIQEYTVLKALSGQVWNANGLSYYQAKGFTVEAIDTGATYTWATEAECAEVTKVLTNLTGINDGIFNGTDNVVIANNVAAVTFDLKAKRTVNRVDICYNENIWNGFQSVTVYASDKKEGLYSEANLVGVLNTSSGEGKGFYPVVSGTSVIAPYTFDAVEAQYIGVVLNSTGADTDNDTTLRQIVIFGEDSKFAPLQKAINEALTYDNAIPYDADDWARLQNTITEAEALLDTDATDETIKTAIATIYDAIHQLDLRGGDMLLSQNVMENAEWTVFQERWPSIRQVVLENASARIMTAAEDGVTGADPSIVGDKVKELFDGGVKMYGGDSGVWSGWQNHGTTYVLYDFGEEVWINGADVASYDYKYYNNTASKFIGEIFVEVSNDGVNFTPAGSASAEEITGDDIGSVLERTTSVTFPAKKARYAKVGVTKGAGTIQYVLMEMWIRGIADFENKLTMTENADGSVTANIFVNTDEENVSLFLANYDKSGRFLGVKMSEPLAGGVGDITVTGNIADGTVAKGMVMNSASGIKPLLPVKTVEKYTEKEFTLSNLFTDGGVLQRGKEVPVFGTATTGTEIIATVNGKEYKTVADGDGKWIVYADAVAAFDVVDISATDGESTFTAGEMLGGEVWLCSGQSNMMYTFDMLNSNELPDNLLEYDTRCLFCPV